MRRRTARRSAEAKNCRSRLSRHDDVIEPLGVRVPLRAAQRRGALAHAALHPRGISDLARVSANSGQLLLHRVRDVDQQTRLLPLDRIDFPHRMRLMVREQFREREVVACQG
jgi:hypothetical protein